MNRLRLLGLWLVVVVATSATTWLVIRSAGAGLTTETTSQPVTPRQRASATPPPTPTPRAPTTPRHRPEAHAETRTWQGAAGTVVTACTGTSIELRGAQANPGWRVEVQRRGPREVEVHFQQGADDGGEAEVQAHCAGGAPSYGAFQRSGDD